MSERNIKATVKIVLTGVISAIAVVAIGVFVYYWFLCRFYVQPGYMAVVTAKTGKAPAAGTILVEKGEKGIWREVLSEGRHFLDPVKYEIKICQAVNIPLGKVGIVTSKVGRELAPGEVIAPDRNSKLIWRDVLGPGMYRLNPEGYSVEIVDAINIPVGFVGVVTSQTGKSPKPGEFAKPGEKGVMRDMLQPGLYYIKDKPTPEDNTPVKLKNRWFASVFELIGSMYALPKYGTIDLTPLFAPFYMLFFAICLNDAGYGAIILAAGLGLFFKGGKSMRQAAWLSILCGGATVLFGTYTGSLFGMSIPEMLGYETIADSPFLDFQGEFFSLALALGVVQILLGMAVNIYMTTRTFGFRYALGNLGWFLLLVAGCLAMALPMLNENFAISWFTTSSPAFYGVAGVALALMLLFNTPGKNIFANIGSGLWNTYNNVTGLLSDVLSYIRLFAIGLSGGVLALVFNSLALGMTGLDAGVEGMSVVAIILKVILASVILLIGHGINLFMSTISSFVHPMRLTFVEFFKNAGFEMASRTFEPFKKQQDK